MILKTYTRLVTTDPDATLAILEALHANGPHLRFTLGDLELAGIGDILVVAGPEAAVAPVRGSLGPWIVDDLAETERVLLSKGAEIVREAEASPTGRFLYARHPDGSVVEYVEWTPELVERFISAPKRAGRLASQL